MFRVSGFCDDKNVPKVLRALQGLMIGAPELAPVIGAEVRGGKIVPDANGGNPVEMFRSYCIKNHLDRFTAQHVKQFVVSIGKPETAYGYLLNKAKTVHAVRKVGGKGQNTEYAWTLPKAVKKGKGK